MNTWTGPDDPVGEVKRAAAAAPRCSTCGRLAGVPSAPCRDCPDAAAAAAPSPSRILMEGRARGMSEHELEAAIVELIGKRPLWLKFHHGERTDQVSTPGFVDMVIVGPGGVLWRENKREGERPQPDQLAWGAALMHAGQDWAVWTPLQLLTGAIELELDALCVSYDPATIGAPGLGMAPP